MKRLCILLLLLLTDTGILFAQEIEKSAEERPSNYFETYIPASASIGSSKLKNVDIDFEGKKLSIYASESSAYQSFLSETVDEIYHQIAELLPGSVRFSRIVVYVNDQPIEKLVPSFFRGKKKDKSRLSNAEYKEAPWVKNISRPYEVTKGLQDRHISLWQSHGKYSKNDKGEWSWQCPRLFCTIEDLFTQSFILPYVIPMLENAGANAYAPCERDTQKNEVIVDNDTRNGSVYLEMKSHKARWNQTNGYGFAQRKSVYKDGENPFLTGTARFTCTERKKNKAFAEWIPTIPEAGSYTVYVSYQTLPNSVSDAKYLVLHKGGVTEFKIDQRIGSGTWVYLGTFEFDKSSSDYGMVVLSNGSNESEVVCADTVRFGERMGNIVRGATVNGLPRYLEGARYSIQRAGMPYDAYGGKQGKNNYANDINARSNTISYLSGDSVFNPVQKGLGVPLEMNVTLHSDAGYSKTDDIVGSLGIYTTNFNNGLLNSGNDRYASRDLADLMFTQIQKDIRTNFNIQWTRRSMRDRNYSETRLPAISSTIIELLSHQNFADMKLRHDPNFKFTVGRAIYKAVLQFVSSQHNKEYVVQPFPVSNFAIGFGKKKNALELSWQGENNPSEPTARPREYIVYTRIEYGGFDNGVHADKPPYSLKIKPGLVCSFKVTAVNRGGESFPSEILAAYKAKREHGKVLIINGFNRLSEPAVTDTPDEAGFDLKQDPDVAYQYNISFCGAQTDFDRSQAGKEGKGNLGYSGGELEGMKITGNTLDYPFIYGKAIQAAGNYSFVPCSDEVAENGRVQLEHYPIVDFILGLEKDDIQSDPARKTYYKTFSSPMQCLLTAYCQSGGNLLVSGSYIGSDMSNSQGSREFTETALKCGYRSSLSDTRSGQISGLGRTIQIPRLPNEESYAVTAPDYIVPVGSAFPVFAYQPGQHSAGIAYKGDCRVFAMGFLLESTKSETDRTTVVAAILKFFGEK